ncbi:MAG: 50S ribosomal protein L10 [Eubacteriales bacterium]|nr:50S ribosomal protein L10 [Eubacteriales bacterium]MDD3883243.1 50S ribosomal protein L10 [Eubacteriales bacterium]MDD4512978.1 50S ribosomal protein L10 [Eubacteriales bacterium]
MSNNLELKRQQVAELVERFKSAKSVVVVNCCGLNVADTTALRNKFRENGVEFAVLKNTLAKRALNEIGITDLDEQLNGPSAFAFGMTDAVAPAKVIKEFVDKTKTEKLTVKIGLMDGKAMTVKELDVLATLPSREVLIARILGSMNATVASFARVLEAIRKKQAGEE